MKKSTQEYLIRQLELPLRVNASGSRYIESIKSMIAEVEAIECEPDCLAQFDEKVLVGDDKNSLHLRHFKGLKGREFECFGGGCNSNEAISTINWSHMKRCLVFEPYTGVKPELKKGEVLIVRDKTGWPTPISFRSHKQINWNNVADYCIYKLPAKGE